MVAEESLVAHIRFEESGFFTSQYKLFRMGLQINPDIPLLGFKENFKRSIDNDVFTTDCELNKATDTAEAYSSRCQRLFDQVEAAGSEISYRCVNCRECKACKNHQEIEAISIKEEVEQSIINASVTVNVKKSYYNCIPSIHS